MMNAWHILGLEPGADERSVKRAYAALLKRTRPEDDAAAYQALREAYEQALIAARRGGAVVIADQPSLAPAREPAPEQQISGVRPDGSDPGPALEPLDTIRGMRARMVLPEPPVVPEPPPAPPRAEPPVPAKFVLPEIDHPALAGAELRGWLAQPGPDLRACLRERLHGEALTDLRTREAFELQAARHCAQAHCPENIRRTLVNELGWTTDSGHLQRLDADAIDTALARYRADLSFVGLQARRSSEPAIDLLLSDRVPHYVPRMMDARFVRQMRAALEEIEWQHADALRFRLDVDIVARWQRKMVRPAYTVQTFVRSFLTGLALTATLQALMWPDRSAFGLIAALSYGLTMGGTALYVLLAPASLRAGATRLGQAALGRLMVNDLYDKLLRGWSLLAGAATMLLFVELPGMTRSVVLLLSGATGLLLLMPVVVRGLYLLIGVQAGAVAVYLYFSAARQYGMLDLLAACLCLAVIKVLRIRWWSELCERIGQRAVLVPASWLAGCILMMIVTRGALLTPPVLAPLTWMLTITGVFYVSSEMPFVSAAVVALALGLSMNYIHLPMPVLGKSLALALEPLLLIFAARAMYVCHKLIKSRAAA